MGKGKYPRAGPRKILILNLNRYRRHCKVGESFKDKCNTCICGKKGVTTCDRLFCDLDTYPPPACVCGK